MISHTHESLLSRMTGTQILTMITVQAPVTAMVQLPALVRGAGRGATPSPCPRVTAIRPGGALEMSAVWVSDTDLSHQECHHQRCPHYRPEVERSYEQQQSELQQILGVCQERE